MRVTFLTGLLVLALCSGAANADVTARYAQSKDGPPTIVVEVNDAGDSRIGDGEGVALVTRDGVSFFVAQGPGGAFAARKDALYAYGRRHPGTGYGGSLLLRGPGRRLTGYRAVEAGAESHGGFSGTVWRLELVFLPSPDGPDFVVSTDPALAPVGAALARQFGRSDDETWLQVGDVVAGGVPGPMLEIIRSGTIIRAMDLLYLHSVSTDPVPTSAFAVPETILGPRQFLRRTERR